MGLRMTVTMWSDFEELKVLLEAEGESEEMAELEKSWAALHFLLTDGQPDRTDLPMGFLRAEVCDSEETRRIAEALEPLTVEALMARYDPIAIAAADLYGVTGGEGDDEYIAGAYEELREVVLEAAEAGKGLLLYIG